MSLLIAAAFMAVRSGDPSLNAVDWANISDSTASPGVSIASTTTETVDGNTADADLTVTWTGSPTSVTYSLDGGGPTAISSGGTVTIPAGGATLAFTFNLTSGSTSGTVTIVNASDGDTAVDTFTFSLTVT